jgi:hypothetical protein
MVLVSFAAVIELLLFSLKSAKAFQFSFIWQALRQ